MNRHVIKEANKYMKRCSILLVIREMENESIMRCQSRMVNIENAAKSSAGENVVTGPLTHCRWEFQLLQLLKKMYLAVSPERASNSFKYRVNRNRYLCALKSMYTTKGNISITAPKWK